jgi:hypothetical protein
MKERESSGTEPAKLESGGDKLGFTADHDDNATSETRYLWRKNPAQAEVSSFRRPMGASLRT